MPELDGAVFVANGEPRLNGVPCGKHYGDAGLSLHGENFASVELPNDEDAFLIPCGDESGDGVYGKGAYG